MSNQSLASLPVCYMCQWWDTEPYGRASGVGLCRKNPPSVMRAWDFDTEERDSWPETTKKDWCGEFLPGIPPPEKAGW